MSNVLYEGLTVEVRHEPDFTLEAQNDGTKVSQELPGFLILGVVVDDVFVPLLRRKAAGLFADIERAKAAASSQKAKDAAAAPPPPSQAPADTSTPATAPPPDTGPQSG